MSKVTYVLTIKDFLGAGKKPSEKIDFEYENRSQSDQISIPELLINILP